jgi:predicted secreted protein
MGIKLTVFFEEPFWVGVFERNEAGKLETARVVFGAEPKDYEVYEYVCQNFNRLSFSRPLDCEGGLPRKINPKRLLC